ncbi:SDR family oxidoreductase [Actinoplanes sp. NPDC049265]|uniref:SDR family oxidoreductase n=1 Tax=Actinoplanes sp. NPDC049265 TaxID=3363902 RepID=UPI00371B01AB
MGNLTGKTAVVTGGSRGIGRAIVERLGHDGATVVFSYQARGDDAAAVEKSVPGSRAVRVDLAAADAVGTLFDGVDELDILVCNAAEHFTPTPVADVTDDDYDRIMGVNARSVFFSMRHAARHMRDGGRIITLSTMNTRQPAPGAAVYMGSKGAIEQFGRALMYELGPRGITVNSVSPGATDTELLRTTNSPEQLRTLDAYTPLGRVGQPADVADVVAFLAGPDGRWITGQNLRASGGLFG